MSNSNVTKCVCGRVLGVQLDRENFEQRHQGRTTKVTGKCSITITCDECGRTMVVRLAEAIKV